MSKYTPIRFEMQQVDRVNYLPTDPDELAAFIASLRSKHGSTVQIVPASSTDTQYSMRGDGAFTTTDSYFSIRAEVPVYSEEDRIKMHKDMQDEAFTRVQNYFKASEANWLNKNGYPTGK